MRIAATAPHSPRTPSDCAAFPENTGGMVNYCFANTEEDAKKIYALGLDFALTDNLDAMLPFFPTRFAASVKAGAQ